MNRRKSLLNIVVLKSSQPIYLLSGDLEDIDPPSDDSDYESPRAPIKTEPPQAPARFSPPPIQKPSYSRPHSPLGLDEQKVQEIQQRALEETKDDLVLFEKGKGFGKFSFMHGFVPKGIKAPAPVYIKYEDIFKTRDLVMADIMDGTIIPPRGAYECIDKSVLDRQKGLMAEVVRQVIVCIFKGQPISGISLPVRAFEPRSQLQRMLDIFGHAPHFFRKAAQTKNTLERLKLVITSAVAGMYGSAKQLKPFNPLLGETYQGYFEDGTRIFCEHTSHHPPITNFFLQGPVGPNGQRLWELSGFYEYTGNKSGKSFKVGQKGPNRLKFYDGHVIEWVNPVFKLSISGPRYMAYVGDVTFWQPQEGRKASLFLDYSKKKSLWKKPKRTAKIDDFQGLIYSINQAGFKKQKFDQKKIYEWDHPGNEGDIKDMDKELCRVEGSWLREIRFNDKQYWEIERKEYPLMAQRASKDPLPSDWRFRQDLIWLKYKNIPFADIWKKELEKLQRLDRKWRNKGRK